MNVSEMTRKEFEAVPPVSMTCDEVLEFDSLIIIPGRAGDLHDSGFRHMDFILVRKAEPIYRVCGGSDVIHIDGIGGFGYDWLNRYKAVPAQVPPTGWSIDCLPKSGLLQIWPGSRRMRCGSFATSSFEIFALSSGEQ